MNWSLKIAAATLAVVVLAQPAEARKRKQLPQQATYIQTCNNDGRCIDVRPQQHNRRQASTQHYDANGNDAVIIGGRPAGCPRKYCGCGLRLHLGIDDKRLNLAANWLRLFPRIGPRPGAAAARSGHVMLLVSHVGDDIWIVRDYNSGRGLSRIHARSVRGFRFVDPTVQLAAKN